MSAYGLTCPTCEQEGYTSMHEVRQGELRIEQSGRCGECGLCEKHCGCATETKQKDEP